MRRVLSLACVFFALSILYFSVDVFFKISTEADLAGKVSESVRIDNARKTDRKSTRLNSSHLDLSRMPSSA